MDMFLPGRSDAYTSARMIKHAPARAYNPRKLAPAGAGRPLLIGVAHAFQQVRSVPVEAWDMPLDAVVTEERVHEFRAGCLS